MGQLKHLVDDLLEVSRITTGRIQLHQERVAVTAERAVVKWSSDSDAHFCPVVLARMRRVSRRLLWPYDSAGTQTPPSSELAVRYPSAVSQSAVPKHWTRSIQTALIHVMSLAHYTLVHTRSWAANGRNDRVRLSAKTDQLDHEIRLLREEIRIKDARLARIPGRSTAALPAHGATGHPGVARLAWLVIGPNG